LTQLKKKSKIVIKAGTKTIFRRITVVLRGKWPKHGENSTSKTPSRGK